MLTDPNARIAVPLWMIITVITFALSFVFVDMLGVKEAVYWLSLVSMVIGLYIAIMIYGFIKRSELRMFISHINILIVSGLLAVFLYSSHVPMPTIIYIPITVSFVRVVYWIITGK
ncbi:hypothetical protein ACFL0F_00225 [Patescibacteria group bacterium]